MTTSPGDRLGHYAISTQLGAGGMGEVYRATDNRLGRQVAIKVLPEDLAGDAERLARFEREARVLASLNHPNIAHLYGLESAVPESREEGARRGEPVTFLVMELVEGEDLEQRIARGPIPTDEAIAIGRQIADALESAHNNGIVHRDLKPGNVRISVDGTVKLLDFGLAKAWEQPVDAGDPSESPTITANMTRAGTLLGTAPYMSPEQARGHAVDRRADIWALGCVLYEMLTGRRAFGGGTATDILAQILEREPLWEALPSTLPAGFRRLLERCLGKDPKNRMRDAGDVALALEDLSTDEPPIDRSLGPPRSRSLRVALPWLVATISVIAAVVSWFARHDPVSRSQPGTLRFAEPSSITLDMSVVGHSGPTVAISPDGQRIAWIGIEGDSTHLFQRRLDEAPARPMAGTEGALTPFFSPDGEWIGFWAGGKLKKVSVRGGVPQTICESSHVHGAAWGDGIIVLGAVGDGSLWWVDPGGGEIQPFEALHRLGIKGEYPRLMPDSRSVLVSSQGRPSVELVSLETGESKTLVNEGSNGSYVSSGHLVWAEQGNLLAAPFDLPSRTVTGNAQTVIEGVLTESSVGTLAHYSVSDDGTLVYVPGTLEHTGQQPSWVSLDGAIEPLPIPMDNYLSPRVAPDGRRVLLSRQTATRTFWVAELERGVMSPVTGDDGDDYWAVWTPDGTGMVFNSIRAGEAANVWLKNLELDREPIRITHSPYHQPPQDITPDGRTVVVGSAKSPTDSLDIHLVHLDEPPYIEPLLATDAEEIHPKVSPDGRWIAYASDVTGDLEIYVRAFRELSAVVRVSPGGGLEPLWSPAGDRLYYRSINGHRVFAVPVLEEDSIRFGREELLFEGVFEPGVRWGRKWDIHPEGDRFLLLHHRAPQTAEAFHVVVNWFAELERLVPTGR